MRQQYKTMVQWRREGPPKMWYPPDQVPLRDPDPGGSAPWSPCCSSLASRAALPQGRGCTQHALPPPVQLQFSEVLVKWRRFFHQLAAEQGKVGLAALETKLEVEKLQVRLAESVPGGRLRWLTRGEFAGTPLRRIGREQAQNRKITGTLDLEPASCAQGSSEEVAERF